ncbi:MAG: hypothetical protein U1B83_05675 [Candidatus Cloacimonadaceae bacterium]|nr:hypothetical protein [Candidatus Cloacimonadaceae bacterium]
MKQFKALMIKEWRTQRNTFMASIWFTSVMYGMVLIALVISLFKSGVIHTANLEIASLGMAERNMISFYANAGVAALLGFVATLQGVTVADVIINGDYRKRCGIFHLSQPVSLLKIMSAKYASLIGFCLAILIGLNLFNSVVISSVMSIKLGSGFFIGMLGALVATIQTVFSFVFSVSLVWLFATAFKKNPLLMGLLIVGGIEASIHVLNYFAGLNIPSLWMYIMRLAELSVKFDASSSDPSRLSDLPAYGKLNIFNWYNLQRVVYAVIFFFAGYHLFRRREIA